MSHCEPEAPVQEIENAPALVPPPPGRSSLVTRPDNRPDQTANRETDAVTALRRGLREYLEQVYLDVLGVRVRFQKVTEVWAESDETAMFPGAAVLTRDQAEYEASSLTPALDTKPVIPRPDDPSDQRTYLVKYAEVTVPLVIELHCSSPEERIQISMLLEDALNPVDWMYGFRLVLPHYFNQVGRYEPVSTQQADTEDSAKRRWRPGTLFLNATVPVVRARSLPGLMPKAVIEVTEGPA